MTTSEVKLRSILKAAIEVVSAFGEHLENDTGASPLSLKCSESELPYGKDVIASAISILQQALRHAESRAILIDILSPEQAQRVLSSQFSETLSASLVFLEDFVPEQEAKAEVAEREEIMAKLRTMADESNSESLDKVIELLGGADRKRTR